MKTVGETLLLSILHIVYILYIAVHYTDTLYDSIEYIWYMDQQVPSGDCEQMFMMKL